MDYDAKTQARFNRRQLEGSIIATLFGVMCFFIIVAALIERFSEMK
jgi:hypothetical protein